jgi:hypothetical protein
VVYVEVGGPGEVGGQGCPPISPCGPGGSPAGGFNGGGAGGVSTYGFSIGPGGGGASDIRLCSASAGTSCAASGGTLASRLVVAGAGAGGDAGAPGGDGGSGGRGVSTGGGAGTQTAGGEGGSVPCFGYDNAGSFGVGGNGWPGSNEGPDRDGASGGGGGGGYYGGGGGGAYDEEYVCGAGGGGGGSSYVTGEPDGPAFTLDMTRTPSVTITAISSGSPPELKRPPQLVRLPWRGRLDNRNRHRSIPVGDRLATTHGRWLGTPPLSYTYQWQRCTPVCTDIDGATRRTYRVTTADLRAHLRAEVTATNGSGSTVAFTEMSDPVTVRHDSGRSR